MKKVYSLIYDNYGINLVGTSLARNGMTMMHLSEIVAAVAYLGSFSTVGGLEGHFASKGKLKDLMIVICFGISWVSIFLSGLN